MAFIPDSAVEALKNREIGMSAWALYSYYCMKRNKYQKGWFCPVASVVEELGCRRPAYLRARKELLDAGWIELKGSDFVIPKKGFEGAFEADLPVENSLNIETKSLKNDTPEISANLKNETQNLKNENDGLKNETQSLKNETAYKDTSHNQPNIPAITSPLKDICEADASPPTLDEGSDEAVGISEKQKKIFADAKVIFEYWQKVTGHPKAK